MSLKYSARYHVNNVLGCTHTHTDAWSGTNEQDKSSIPPAMLGGGIKTEHVIRAVHTAQPTALNR